jgi:transcriptional regulator GlxA family with amidase domain
LSSPTATKHTPGHRTVKHIGILVFDDVEELDAVGPWEVLANWTQNHPHDGWTVFLLSWDGQPVHAAKGMVIGAHHSFATAPPLRVLVHPGGPGTRSLMRDSDHLAWVRQQRVNVPLLTSVCTGALVYAAAGVLARRPATTHWGALELLHSLDPSIDVQDSAAFVDDGDVITSAGVSAGIDMALHLLTRLAGADRAATVSRDLQYEWRPAAHRK